jgi:hypothetical protein
MQVSAMDLRIRNMQVFAKSSPERLAVSWETRRRVWGSRHVNQCLYTHMHLKWLRGHLSSSIRIDVQRGLANEDAIGSGNYRIGLLGIDAVKRSYLFAITIC